MAAVGEVGARVGSKEERLASASPSPEGAALSGPEMGRGQNGEEGRRVAGHNVESSMPASPFASSDGPSIVMRAGEAGDNDIAEQRRGTTPQRMVSWQDDVLGQELVTIREFEPSEGLNDSDSPSWQQNERKSCCSLM